MAQFKYDYARGKQSEVESLPDLQKIFGDDLKLDPYQYAHFDYHNDTHMVELKTRDRVKYKNGVFEYTTRNGYEMILDSLYFDLPKLEFRNKQKKNGCKKIYYVLWKCNSEYFGWIMNNSENEFTIEPQFRDCGHGYKQNRNVVKVKSEHIYKLS